MKKSVIIALSLVGILILGLLLWFITAFVGWRCICNFGSSMPTINIYDEGYLRRYVSYGSGVESDPYVIEGKTFGKDVEHIRQQYTLLKIQNINTHLIIQNCHFIGGENFIWIEEVQGSITIQSCTFNITTTRIGCGWSASISYGSDIILRYTSNIHVLNNNFTGFMDYPISIWQCSEVEVNGNTFTTSLSNVLYDSNWNVCPFYDVDDIIITNNFNISLEIEDFENCIISNNYMDIYLLKGRNLTMVNNQLDFLSDYGYWLEDMDNTISVINAQIQYNVFQNLKYGLLFDESQEVLLTSNIFTNCSNYAIKILSDSSQLFIFHNSFFNNNLLASSQCYDNGTDVLWYSQSQLEGNFWSNLGNSTTYLIDGIAGSVDLYPLSTPPI